MIKQKKGKGRLSEFQQGSQVIISRIEGAGTFKKRLLEMGFTPGMEIQIVKYAPLKDPMEIRIKNCHVSLRVCEAEKISVANVNDCLRSHAVEGAV